MRQFMGEMMLVLKDMRFDEATLRLDRFLQLFCVSI